jgi:CRP-like cAMP-binding protein/small-conductance mechanosensitive channel
MSSELLWAIGLFVGTVVTAAVVNRFAPTQRPRLRRLVILYFVYALTLGAYLGLKQAGVTVWAGRLEVAAEILQDFTLVNLAGTLILSVLLPSVGFVMPMIASDLVVGIAYIVTALGVLSGHGLNPTGALATGAVVSAVLAISLQSTLGNILGGVALQLDGSIHEGDWIQLENGKQGRVRSIRWRHTVVETRDWSTIIVPNALLLANNLTILGWREGRYVPQRMWVWFNVDYRFAPTRVIQVVTDALHSSPIENVADDPMPNVVCMDFTKERRESFATYAARYWIKDLMSDDGTNSRVRARIYTALRRAGIPLAVPAHTAFVEMHDEERADRREKRNLEQRLEAIRTVHLFRSLTEGELRLLAEGLKHAIYTAGELITRQNAVAHWLYVLTSGSVEVRTRVDPDGSGPLPEQSKLVATLHGPDFFGEMGLMTGEPRLADVFTTSDVECYRLDKETFERVLLKRPEIANELSDRLATRRVELLAVRDNLDKTQMEEKQKSERERILGAIKTFFSL